MKRSVWLWQLFGFAATSLGGVLLHFLYEWLGRAVWVAAFSGVNESTWEHMKLLFWPMLAFALLQSLFFRDRKDFWCVKLEGILIGITLIPVIFYTYNGAVGVSPAWLNIAFFFICAAIAFLYEGQRFSEADGGCCRRAAILALIALALMFILFTFATPRINLFKDPIAESYGIGTYR